MFWYRLAGGRDPKPGEPDQRLRDGDYDGEDYTESRSAGPRENLRSGTPLEAVGSATRTVNGAFGEEEKASSLCYLGY